MFDHVSLRAFEQPEGFPTFLTFISFLSIVISFIKKLKISEGSPTYTTFIWFLSIFLILRGLVSSLTFDVTIMG